MQSAPALTSARVQNSLRRAPTPSNRGSDPSGVTWHQLGFSPERWSRKSHLLQYMHLPQTVPLVQSGPPGRRMGWKSALCNWRIGTEFTSSSYTKHQNPPARETSKPQTLEQSKMASSPPSSSIMKCYTLNPPICAADKT